MDPNYAVLSPRQLLDENLHPAELLLSVYKLLECEELKTDGEILGKLRTIVGARADEDLILISNEIFLGLVRERARMARSELRRATLDNLLRQAVVASCTGLDTYLPALLRMHLPTVIKLRKRDFLPVDDNIQSQFKELTFTLADVARIIGDPDAPLFIVNKILGQLKTSYMSSKRGVHVTGALLAIEQPWAQIAQRLGRDRKELMDVLEATTTRRNDIVHRADRPQSNPESEIQEIGLAWAQQAVNTVKDVCYALDELVKVRLAELNHQLVEVGS